MKKLISELIIGGSEKSAAPGSKMCKTEVVRTHSRGFVVVRLVEGLGGPVPARL